MPHPGECGGIYFENSTSGALTINKSLIRYNQSDSNLVGAGGGGLYLINTYVTTITDTTISDNVAVKNGGWVYIENSSISINNSQVDNNSAIENGGGLSLDEASASSATIDNGSI